MKAGGEAGHAQHAQRVLAERGGYVAQHPVREVLAATERIHQCAGIVPGHGIDGQVPALEILLDGDVRIEGHAEAVVAATLFAFRACQGVFLTRARMQKHRKGSAHLSVTLHQEIIRRGPGDHPVPLGDFQAQQFIADGAANEVGGGGHQASCSARALRSLRWRLDSTRYSGTMASMLAGRMPSRGSALSRVTLSTCSDR